MNGTTRTAYLDSFAITQEDISSKSKQQRKSLWYGPLVDFIKHMSTQFLLVTTLYVMEPWEKMLIMSIFFLVIALVSYSAFVYIPFHIHPILQWTMKNLTNISTS